MTCESMSVDTDKMSLRDKSFSDRECKTSGVQSGSVKIKYDLKSKDILAAPRGSSVFTNNSAEGTNI